MAKRKRKRKTRDEQPYKVSVQFKRWMDSQIDIMWNYEPHDRWDRVENEIQREAYTFIRGLLK